MTYRLVGDRYFFPSHGRPTAYIETSRGCPYRCRYCYQSNRKLLWRRASPAWVVRALDHIKNETPDVRHLYFADDNYFYDRDRTITITEEMIRANRDLTYQVQGAALMDLRELSDADLALIARSGCLRMDIGAETGAPEMAKVIGKIVDPGLLLETVGRLSKAGIIPWINFMAGFPGESESDLKHTLDDIESLVRKVPRVMISPVYTFYPYPGTRLFDQSVRHGFKPPATIEEIAGSSWRVPKTPWLSAGKRTFLERLYFYSIFIDGKVPFYSRTFWTRLGHAVMRPLSRLRLRHRFFSLPVEKYLFEAVNGVEY
ncbi:MAG: radical SAM protein [Deltaproteobacteria bacterium]|nr:radical SAM protein [Deltaproteobacteria bacterium]